MIDLSPSIQESQHLSIQCIQSYFLTFYYDKSRPITKPYPELTNYVTVRIGRIESMNDRLSETTPKTSSWKKYNPNIPIFLVVIILSIVIVATVEIVLSIVEGTKIYKLSAYAIRTIRLKEHPISSSFIYSPDVYYLEVTDSLEKKMYLFEVDDNGFVIPSKIHDDPDMEIVFLGRLDDRMHVCIR